MNLKVHWCFLKPIRFSWSGQTAVRFWKDVRFFTAVSKSLANRVFSWVCPKVIGIWIFPEFDLDICGSFHLVNNQDSFPELCLQQQGLCWHLIVCWWVCHHFFGSARRMQTTICICHVSFWFEQFCSRNGEIVIHNMSLCSSSKIIGVTYRSNLLMCILISDYGAPHW